MSMDNKPLVSIVVPIYNVEEYLEDCINSIIFQTYKNIEIILVDDGSKDSSGVICDKYAKLDARVKGVHKLNGGLSSARNAGIDVATGKYLTFVDSDDMIAPESIMNLSLALLSLNCKIVKMNMTSDFGQLNTYESKDSKVYTASEYLKRICTYSGSVSFCDKLFDKSVFNSYKFKEGVLNEDLLLLCTLLLEKQYRIAEIEYTGYFYRQRNASITTKKFGKSIQDSVINCEHLVDLSISKMPELCVYFRQLLLYQAMCYFIAMPNEYIKENNSGYQNVKYIFLDNKNYINDAFFSSKFKWFIRLCILSPKIAKMIVNLIGV